MTVRVDPEGVVAETREANHVCVASLGAPLNLTARRIDAEAPRVGVPGWFLVEARVTGGDRLQVGVDEVVLGMVESPRREDVQRALDSAADPGTSWAFARLVDPERSHFA